MSLIACVFLAGVWCAGSCPQQVRPVKMSLALGMIIVIVVVIEIEIVVTTLTSSDP